ncbi:PLP-dependent transferase [Pseudonocardia sp. RS010]|uniref:PLP-dependent transferase n=1 Tax=Pseudonocardia sp. RS010 TaxID=3385979 RepID=UPI0039A0F219
MERPRLQTLGVHAGNDVDPGTGAIRTMSGFGGMLAFAVRGDADTQNRFVANLRVITSAVSLGHDESLIVHVSAGDERAAAYPEEFRRWGAPALLRRARGPAGSRRRPRPRTDGDARPPLTHRPYAHP